MNTKKHAEKQTLACYMCLIFSIRFHYRILSTKLVKQGRPPNQHFVKFQAALSAGLLHYFMCSCFPDVSGPKSDLWLFHGQSDVSVKSNYLSTDDVICCYVHSASGTVEMLGCLSDV